jgi:hypothetical protein
LDLLSHLSPTTLFIQATSYLSDRKQCVKLGQLSSQMLEIYKGVLQGSILGPILLKILLTIFSFLLKKNVISTIMLTTIHFENQITH